jgi:hypothetical protein
MLHRTSISEKNGHIGTPLKRIEHIQHCGIVLLLFVVNYSVVQRPLFKFSNVRQNKVCYSDKNYRVKVEVTSRT